MCNSKCTKFSFEIAQRNCQSYIFHNICAKLTCAQMLYMYSSLDSMYEEEVLGERESFTRDRGGRETACTKVSFDKICDSQCEWIKLQVCR